MKKLLLFLLASSCLIKVSAGHAASIDIGFKLCSGYGEGADSHELQNLIFDLTEIELSSVAPFFDAEIPELKAWIYASIDSSDFAIFEEQLIASGIGEKLSPVPSKTLNKNWCEQTEPDFSYLKQIHAIKLKTQETDKSEPVVIAIIDDAFRLSHQALQPFWFINRNEIANNGRDDDANGYVDDSQGWDVSDGDGDVTVGEELADTYYHGTHIAGILSSTLSALFEEPEHKFKFMPIKAISNHASTTYLKEAYNGFAYAVATGADVINCSWGESTMTAIESELLELAVSRKIQVIAAAGNFRQEKAQYPAAAAGVVAVTALNRKLELSQRAAYGAFVDFAMPGEHIAGAASFDDELFWNCSGSSMSTAMITAAIAGLKYIDKNISSNEFLHLLKATALPVDQKTAHLHGKLGAGISQIATAIEASQKMNNLPEFVNLPQSEGVLLFESGFKDSRTYAINHFGKFSAFQLSWAIDPTSRNACTIGIQSIESKDTYNLNELPFKQTVKGDQLQLTLNCAKRLKSPVAVRYEPKFVDSVSLNCSEMKELQVEIGTCEDGSGESNYAPLTNCKWVIHADSGKVIELRFKDFETENLNDVLYVFDGTRTNQGMRAQLSGTQTPPVIRTHSNVMMLWFLTNETVQKSGWSASFKAIDPK